MVYEPVRNVKAARIHLKHGKQLYCRTVHGLTSEALLTSRYLRLLHRNLTGYSFDRRVDYIPPNMPWEMSEVLVELLRQAHYLLKPGGRLVSTLRHFGDCQTKLVHSCRCTGYQLFPPNTKNPMCQH